MKNYLVAIIFIVLCMAFTGGSQPGERLFNKLYGLQGKWIMKTKKGAIGEEWIKIDSNYLQSKGFMIRGSDTIITERVSLKNTKEGIFYTSTVQDQNNQQPVPFKLTSSTGEIFVFENPAHDYPKKISYHLINHDSLEAWIDDGKAIPTLKSIFRYSRQQ